MFLNPDSLYDNGDESHLCTMIGTIVAGCTLAELAMWAVTTVLRLTAIALTVVQLKRE